METDLATVTYCGRLFVVEAVEFHGGASFVTATVEGEPVMVSRAVGADLAALFAAARGSAASNAPERVLDTDAANVGRRHRGESRAVHSRSAGVRCRPGRAW